MGNCVTINTNNRGVVAPMDPQGGGTSISNTMGGEEEEEELSCLESLGCMLCG
jgi:hypothetical protein